MALSNLFDCIISYQIAIGIVMATLTHSGKLLFGSSSSYFSDTLTGFTTVWSLVARNGLLLSDEIYGDKQWIGKLYKAIALIFVFVLWRVVSLRSN